MRRRTALALGVAALAGCSSVEDVLDGPDPREAETLIREGINEFRSERDLPTLPSESALQTAAREHCRDMAERDFYSHENPDGAGPSDRAGCPAGEVIHRGEIGEMRNEDGTETWSTALSDGLAGFVVEGWRLSDDHRELLASRRWSAVGVGVHIDESEFFATAVFC